MNNLKKQEISLYITSFIGLCFMGILSGDIKMFAAFVATFTIVIGSFYGIFKAINYILNKIYPESNTKTLGGVKTITTNFTYESKQ